MSTLQDAVNAYQANDYAAARAICAEHGRQPHARFMLGLMDLDGEGGPVDPVAAAGHFKVAADAGHAAALLFLGRMVAAGTGGLSRDPAAAALLFFKAWQADIDEAEPEIIRVRAGLEEAAEAGNADAQNTLALILCFGHDEPAAAAEWFARAAAQGHPEATRMLGYLHAAEGDHPQDSPGERGV